MTASKKILIAGSGLTGSLLAILLGKRGYTVEVLEKRRDLRKSQGSAGRSINLAISTRGIAALEYAGVKERVMHDAIPMHGRMIHNRDSSLSFQPYSSKKDEYINAISRADLNNHLMNAAEEFSNVSIQYEKTVQAFDLESGEVTFLDERTGKKNTAHGDIVIGADGFSSAIREGIIHATGGKAEVEQMTHGYKELFIDAIPGTDLYKMEKNALHIWPRGSFMMIALPNPGGSFTVTLFMEQTQFDEIGKTGRIREFFSEFFPDSLAVLDQLEETFLSHPLGTLGTLHCSPWIFQDKALIMGDAAHAIVPFYGQGMNACFEDCVVLDKLLDKYEDDWQKVLPKFYELRKPNADAIAELALANYIEMRDLTGRESFQKAKLIERRLVELYPHDYLPVYSMVSFSHLPYSYAWSCKSLQDRLLSEISARHHSVDQVNRESIQDIMNHYQHQVEQIRQNHE